MGAIAIRLAMGGTGHADFSGAVAELATMPVGPFLLWGSFAACAALSLWQTGDAIFDFNHQPTRKKIKNKAKAALQAIVYAVLALTLWHFAMGTGTGDDNRKAASDFTISMMQEPWQLEEPAPPPSRASFPPRPSRPPTSSSAHLPPSLQPKQRLTPRPPRRPRRPKL